MKFILSLGILIILFAVAVDGSFGYNNPSLPSIEKTKVAISEFLGLTDTPSSYVGEEGKCVVVGSGVLEFGNCANATDLNSYVPYTGATANVNLGSYMITSARSEVVSNNDATLRINSTGGTMASNLELMGNGATYYDWRLRNSGGNLFFQMSTNDGASWSERVFFGGADAYSGRVGIGTLTPSQTLDVQGNIISKDNITASDWLFGKVNHSQIQNAPPTPKVAYEGEVLWRNNYFVYDEGGIISEDLDTYNFSEGSDAGDILVIDIFQNLYTLGGPVDLANLVLNIDGNDVYFSGATNSEWVGHDTIKISNAYPGSDGIMQIKVAQNTAYRLPDFDITQQHNITLKSEWATFSGELGALWRWEIRKIKGGALNG